MLADHLGTLILGSVRVNLRNLRHLMPSWLPLRCQSVGLLRQLSPAVLAEFVEFLLRRASCRSKSVICFSCSVICFSCSVICFSCSAIFFWASASSFSRSAMRSLRFWTFSRSRSNSCRRNFSEDRGRLEPNFAATRRVVLAIIQHKLTHSPEFVQRKCRKT